ncbi:lyase family protein, partial [Burkholderia pseudomallei]
EKQSPELIHALALSKRAAAAVNLELGVLARDKANAIVAAAAEIIAGRHAADFPLAGGQTGSGAQTNMNRNEEIANRASELLG